MIEESIENSSEISISWNNLNIIADVKKQRLFCRSQHTYKTIIKNANGAIHAGNMVALIGASGSGKTTLLSVLANRDLSGLIVTGSILIGGRNIGQLINQISGYVYQDDMFWPNLTVMEYLNFMGQLRLGGQVTKEQRAVKIMELLITLGIEHVKDTIINSSSFGNSKVNLSGGEMKRLSVAAELIIDPLILFCDEPTTGLDSYSACKLITTLNRKVCAKNKMIICSIHQLNDQIYELFHQVILLHKGQIVFMGPSKDAVPYFERYGCVVNKDEVQASFLIRCLTDKDNTNEERFYLKLSDDYTKIQSAKCETQIAKIPGEIEIKSVNWFYKLYLLTFRHYLQSKRDPSFRLMYLLQIVLVAFFIGTCTAGSVTYTQYGVQALSGILFSLMTESLFIPMYATIGYFSQETSIFYREYVNGVNTPLIFFISNMLSLIPNFIFCPILLTVVLYWSAGLKSTWVVLVTSCLITILVTNISAAYGLLMLIIFKSADIASFCSNPVTYIVLILSGYSFQLRSLPMFIWWINYVSWVKLGLETLMVLQLQDVDYIECPLNPVAPCFETGSDVLYYFNYSENNLGLNIWNLVLLYIIINVMSFIIFLKTLK